MQNLSEYRELMGLTQVPKIGAQRVKLLLQHFDSAENIFAANQKDLQRIEGIGLGLAQQITGFDAWDDIDEILEKTEDSDAWLLDLKDSNYPELLKHIYDPPILLWGLGDPLVLNEPMLSVVGTRKMSSYGEKMAQFLTKGLVQQDIVIISGLALGVDETAHQTTIDNGGRTVAVLGSGIDWIYPSQNRKLAKQIIKTGGAILSEFPPGSKPDARNFPPRNRIVSGMSHGAVVVESGLKGGSMITARVALDQNREVFSVPHRADRANGKGCNALIQRGWAKLVTNAEDILEDFPELEFYKPDTGATTQPEESTAQRWMSQIETMEEEEVEICKILGNQDKAVHIDTLAEQADLPVHQLTSILLQLEMRDLVEQHAGKHFTIR